jgi:hypothetical protein
MDDVVADVAATSSLRVAMAGEALECARKRFAGAPDRV